MSKPARTISSYLKTHRTALAIGFFFLLLTNAFDKAIPWLLSDAIDALRKDHYEDVKRYALYVVGAAFSMAGVRVLSRVYLFNIGRDVEFELRNELLTSLHRLGASFTRRMSTGDIMSRAINDLGQVRLLLGFGLLNAVNSVVAYASAVGLMLKLSPTLTAYAMIPYPFFVMIARWFSRAMYKRSLEAQQAVGKLSERAQENLAGLRLVRALGLERFETRRFNEVNQNAIDKNMALVSIRGFMFPVLMLLNSMGTLIVIWVGGRMVLHDELSVGKFAAFNFYLGQLLWPTMAFGYLLSVIQRGRASYNRVRDLCDADPDIVDVANPKEASVAGALSVEGLAFSHGDRKILEDVSFKIPAGSSFAIVGKTGSGKSTLAALLPRLLPTPTKSVFLDGTDVTDIRLRSLRKEIGFAQQEPFLFSTTIARNIGFSLDDPDSPEAFEKIRHAAKEAAIGEEIESMADGFDTIVGERGVQLSGGQRQRIALARALLNEPAVLVLDDPLSAVDAKTESQILEALSRAGEKRTLVLVTHRIAASQRTERIVVLDHGRVVETGTHDELIAAKGIYAELASKQRREQEMSSL